MIYVDTHEPKDLVEKIKNKGYNTTVTNLKIGDYVWQETCIERKTTSDYLNSLFKGTRLWDQAYDMLCNYKHPVFIIEGGFIYPYSKKDWFKLVSMLGSVGRLIQKFNCSVLTPRNKDMTANLICSMYKASESKGTSLKPVTIHKGKRSMEEIQEDILTCFPAIGRNRAKLILKEYKSLKDVWEAVEIETLSNIKGISKSTADRIKSIIVYKGD